MSKPEFVARILSNKCQIPNFKFDTRALTKQDVEKIKKIKPEMDELKNYLIIEDEPSIGVSDIIARTKMHEIVRGCKISAIFIDYLQLMKIEGRKANRNEDVGEISRQLKILAKTLDIPVIAGSQLNRGVEDRENKRPISSDLRDSGSLEQDSDCVIFCYYDFKYSGFPHMKDKFELIIDKQRGGTTGTLHLYANFDYQTFNDSKI